MDEATREVRMHGGPHDGETLQVSTRVHVLIGADLSRSSEHGVLAHRYLEQKPDRFVYGRDEWV